MLDFTGTRRPARGQSELPAGGDAFGLLVRGAGADRSRHPAFGGRLPADRGDRAGGCAAQREAGCGGRGRQRGDLLARGRPRAERVRPSAGPGHDEQPDAGQRGLRFYETLGGGQGACADADGPSGVHVAMSNTLNTPVEALERELPLRVVSTRCVAAPAAQAASRRRRRGARGGSPQEMHFSLIAERRRHAPPGAQEAGRVAGPDRCSRRAVMLDTAGARSRVRFASGERFASKPREEDGYGSLNASDSWAWESWARAWPPMWPGRATS